MIIATAIILILALILICILVVPFNIFLKLKIFYFQTCNDQLQELKIDGLKIKGYFKLTWIKIRLFQKKFPDKNKEKDEKKEIKKEDKKEKFDTARLSYIISLLYESSPYLIRVFNAFFKSTSFEKFSLKLRLGLDSPYDTAVISGYLYALMPLLNLIPKACFLFEPEFQKEQLKVTIKLKFRIKLLWIIIEIVRAFTKKPVRSLFNELRKMR